MLQLYHLFLNEFTYASILVNGTKAVTFQHQLVLFCQHHPQHLSASLFLGMIPPFIVAVFLQRYISEMNIVDPLGNIAENRIKKFN